MAFMLPVLKSDHPNLVKTRRHSTPANMKPKSQSLSEYNHPRLSISVSNGVKRQKSKSICAQMVGVSGLTAMTSVRTPRSGSNSSSRTAKLSCQMEMTGVRDRKPSVSQATSLATASPTIVIEPAFSQNDVRQPQSPDQSSNYLRSRSPPRKFSLSSSPKAFANFWTLIAKQAATSSASDAFNRG